MTSIFTTPLYARTSKLIYDHSETVQITVDGVTIGGKVVLSIADDLLSPGDNGIADTYKALTIVDGGKGDLDHVKNGVIVTNWKAPANLQAANATLNLTATDLGADGRAGTADDRIATTAFQDKAPAAAKLTVVSDKADYAPGETALLTVNNVKVGGKVTFSIADDPSDPGSDGIANTYQKFTIVDGGKGDLDGLKNGSITAKWMVPANGSALDATLDVRVVDHGNDGRIGTADDRAAVTTFTDSGATGCTFTFSASGIASGGYNFITLSQGDLRLVIDNVIGSDVQVSQASGGGIGIGNNNIEQGEKISFSFEESDGSEVCADTFTTTIKADAGNPDLVWVATLADGTTVVLDDGTNPPGGDPGDGGADVTYTLTGSGDYIATVDLASGECFTDLTLRVLGGPNDKIKLGLTGFSITIPCEPAIAIDKTFVNVTGGDGDAVADAVGDVLNYTVTVTNTGNVTLTGVTVVDPLTGQNISGVTLAAGASQTYNTSYTLTQADLDNKGGGDGDIDNTATADSNQTGPVSDTATVPLVYCPGIAIDKTFVNVTGGDGDAIADAVGDVLNYTVTVTNTGNVTLTGVTVVDPLTGQNISGVTLAPGASQTYNTTYTLTQADLDNQGGGDGDIDNTATADSNQTDPVCDTATVPLVYNPALAIDKTFVNVTGGDGDAIADTAGDVLNYTVTVTNTGNVTLTGVTVVDPLTGQNISGVTLAPGASQTYNTAYTLTQADLDNQGGGDGDVDNTATADSDQTGPVCDTETVPLVYCPGIAIDKTFVNVTGGDGDAIADTAGDVLNYTVTVTNTGNVTLTGVTVVDPLTGQNISGVTLAPGASQTYNTAYTLTQADLDTQGGGDGDIDNTATAGSNQTDPVCDTETVPLVYSPALAIDKTFVNVTGGDGDAFADAAGDVLNYTVTVTNTGNVTLTGVTVVDPLTGQNISGVTLAPGASQTYNTAYTLTQADLDGAGNAGSDHDIDNVATADSNETGPVSDNVTVPLVEGPALVVDKTFINVTGGDGDALADAVGDVLNYTVTVTNTGNVTLTGVTVVDPLTGQNISGVTLAPGASQTYNTSYTLTQADLDGAGNAGSDHDIDNTATADSNQTDPVCDTETVPLVYCPGIAIDKTFVNVTGGDGDAIADTAGDVLNYTVTVTNTGNVTLTGVTVVDPLTGQNISGVTLAPGASQTYNTAYTLTQADLDTQGGGDGDIDNTATADSDQTGPVCDTATVPLVYCPDVAIDKTFVNVTGGDGDALADAAGDVLNYTVTVTNTGNVTLTGVTVVDPLTGQNISGVTLAPGASQTYNTAYTLTQADLDGAGNAGSDHDIDNTATADSDQTGPVCDSETVPLVQNPSLTLDKQVCGVNGNPADHTVDNVGDVINYKILLANTGNMSISNVVVTDYFESNAPVTLDNASVSGDLNHDGILDVGETWTYSYNHTVTQSEIDTARSIVTTTTQIGVFTCVIEKCTGDLDLDNMAVVTATAGSAQVYATDRVVAPGYHLSAADFETVDVSCPNECVDSDTSNGSSTAEQLWQLWNHQQAA